MNLHAVEPLTWQGRVMEFTTKNDLTPRDIAAQLRDWGHAHVVLEPGDWTRYDFRLLMYDKHTLALIAGPEGTRAQTSDRVNVAIVGRFDPLTALLPVAALPWSRKLLHHYLSLVFLHLGGTS